MLGGGSRTDRSGTSGDAWAEPMGCCVCRIIVSTFLVMQCMLVISVSLDGKGSVDAVERGGGSSRVGGLLCFTMRESSG